MKLCVIPARGGSKRIPKKNIKHFHGKPIIAYSIEVAKEAQCFDRIIVSTDDNEIKKIAEEFGAEVPFMRPKELSDDFTGTGEVIEHAITWLRKNNQHFDYVCTIYATAPLLQKKYLLEGLRVLKSSNASMTFSVVSFPSPIQRAFKITNQNRCEMLWAENFFKRSQDLEETYHDAAQFYWQDIHNKSTDITFGKDSIPIILPRYLVQDIDTNEDWKRAEFLYKTYHDLDI